MESTNVSNFLSSTTLGRVCEASQPVRLMLKLSLEFTRKPMNPALSLSDSEMGVKDYR